MNKIERIMSILNENITISIPIRSVPWTWYVNHGFTIKKSKTFAGMVSSYDLILSQYRAMTITPNGIAKIWPRSKMGKTVAPPLDCVRIGDLDELEQILIKWTEKYGNIK